MKTRDFCGNIFLQKTRNCAQTICFLYMFDIRLHNLVYIKIYKKSKNDMDIKNLMVITFTTIVVVDNIRRVLI